MTKLKILTVGSSVGIVLPKELLAKLRVDRGDTIFAVETPYGVELTAYDASLERQLEIAEGVMRENREVLRKLAGKGLEEPIWLNPAAVHAIHQRQLAEHGGLNGERDPGGLEAALARPWQIFACADPPPDLAALAAAYAQGVVRNRPFVDGNKRVALVVALTFLRLNSCDLAATPDAKFVAITSLASREMPEEQFAAFVRSLLLPWPPAR